MSDANPFPPPLMAPNHAMNIGRLWFAMAEQYDVAEMYEEAERARHKSKWWLAYARTLAATRNDHDE